MSRSAEAPEPLPLLTAQEMRAWDERAIRGSEIPERLLMENAGRAAARLVHDLYPLGRVVAAVGAGNNGGDALVALRCLRSWGRDVLGILVAGEPRSRLLHGWDVPLADIGGAEAALGSAAVILDGLLGTGASGPPRDPYADAIRAMAAAGVPVVALDGPSGVDFTTGTVAGDAVRAALTISFGAPKRGLLLHPGRDYVGRLLVAEIGFPPLEPAADAALITDEWAAGQLPHRPWNAHKGVAGKVVIVAGRAGMGGAAVLAGMGALRSGAGVARIASCDENRLLIQTRIPEALFSSRDDADLRSWAESADAIAIGPAMGTGDDSAQLLSLLLENGSAPTLLDADALTLLSREPELLTPEIAGRVLLTPHPLEMARLLGCDLEEVTGAPFEAARKASETFACAVLLKGAPSIVAVPGGPTLVSTTGHSGVATGGMGDTLAGVAGTLLAAGVAPGDAGALALHLCGRAAELAGRGRGLLPRDVAEALPAAIEGLGTPMERGAGILLDLPPPQ